MPVIPTLERSQKEDQEFEYSLGYMTPCLKKEKEEMEKEEEEQEEQEEEKEEEKEERGEDKDGIRHPTYKLEAISAKSKDEKAE